jgi:class 3 adenylate cyclase
VVFEGNDVFGDWVNIASRLEPLAPPGGILVSNHVHRNIVNKRGIKSVNLGEKELKGVDEPLKVYLVTVEAMRKPGRF